MVGWQFLKDEYLQILFNNKKSVCIYPHTSYWDFVISLVYKYAYNVENLYVVINEGFYNKYKILKYLNCIPATAKERNNGGFIEETSQKFKDIENFHILISPEGTLKKVPWRSGYYYLAEKLNAEILIVGFDYVKHEIIIKKRDIINCGKENTETQLKQLISDIVPLYPEYSEVPIIYNGCTSVIDWCTLTSLICPFYGLIIMYNEDFLTWLLLLIGWCFSGLYHHSHEHKYVVIEPITVLIGLINYVVYIYIKNIIRIDTWAIIFILFSIITYTKAFGRKKHKHRTWNYILYHNLFHVFASCATIYMYNRR
jgi:1-acyl-sn-glycerol-3-phosphate acyltransferase